jgi:hypothetical protein
MISSDKCSMQNMRLSRAKFVALLSSVDFLYKGAVKITYGSHLRSFHEFIISIILVPNKIADIIVVRNNIIIIRPISPTIWPPYLYSDIMISG